MNVTLRICGHIVKAVMICTTVPEFVSRAVEHTKELMLCLTSRPNIIIEVIRFESIVPIPLNYNLK